MSVYGRHVVLAVGPDGGTGREWVSRRGVDSLRIAFDVTRDDTSEPDQGSVMVWNLAKSTRDWLDESAEVLTLAAGFGDRAGRIWSAEVATVSHRRTGPDIVTTIEGGDAEARIASSTLFAAFSAGTSNVAVLDALAGALGVQVGYAPPYVLNHTTARGISIAGNAMDRLVEMAQDFDCVVTTQDGAIYMYPVEAGTVDVVLYVSPDSGMQAHPQPLRSTGAVRDGDRPGITFSAMVDDRIVPGRRVVVEGVEQFAGEWVVRKARYIGDSQQDGYSIEVEATASEQAND